MRALSHFFAGSILSHIFLNLDSYIITVLCLFFYVF
jgi:hypothetical protein